MKKILFLLPMVLLFGCAGSPVHTSSMSSQELVGVDDYTLCKAATPREMYEPSGRVIMEVRRRRLNCSEIYTYRPMNPILLQQSIQLLNGAQQQAPQPEHRTYIINGRIVNCNTFGNVTNCN